MNADWKVEKAQYAEFNAPTCDKIAIDSCAKKDNLCGTVTMAWT